MTIKLRDYQDDTIKAIKEYVGNGGKAGLVCLPTGSGKSVIPAAILKDIFQTNPYTRALMVTHRKTLIEQNFKALKRMWSDAPCGIFSAGLKRKDYHDAITYCGIQSVYKKAELFGKIDIVLVDEVHLVSPNSETMYGSFLSKLREVNPNLCVIGMTATAFRLDSGMLIDGDMFDDSIIDLTLGDDFTWFIDQGYLCEVHAKDVDGRFDTSDVAKSKGEFILRSLTEKFNRTEVSERIVNTVLARRGDRKHGLTFAISIEHAEELCRMYNDVGITAVVAHSKLSDDEVAVNIECFTSGRCEMLVDVERYTTGFDYPNINLIVTARPTESASLHIQMNGRGTRPVYAEGFDLTTKEGRLAAIAAGPKPDGCMVLDFAGNSLRLGPMNAPVTGANKPEQTHDGEMIAPQKICPMCLSYVHAAKSRCETRNSNGMFCSYEFPQGEEVSMSGEIIPGILIRRDSIREDRLYDIVNYFVREGVSMHGKPFVTVTIIAKGLKDTISETMYISDKAFVFAKDVWKSLLPNEPYPYVFGNSVEQNSRRIKDTLDDKFDPKKALVWVNHVERNKVKPKLLGVK